MFLLFLGDSICRHGVLTMLMACIHLNHEQLDQFGFFLGTLTQNHKETAGGGGGSDTIKFSSDGIPSFHLDPIYRDRGSPYVNMALKLLDILDEEWTNRAVKEPPLAKSLFDALIIVELARVAEEIYTYAELDKDLYAVGEAVIEARRKDDDDIEREALNAKNALELTKKRYKTLLGYAKRAKEFVEQYRSDPKSEVPYEWLKSVNINEQEILNDETASMEEDYDDGYSYEHDHHHHDHGHDDHGLHQHHDHDHHHNEHGDSHHYP